jgi:serine/threonine-protein kinase RsbT
MRRIETREMMRFRIASETDLSRIVMEVKRQSQELGFDAVDAAKVSSAASELLRNVLKYAASGHATVRKLHTNRRIGLEFVVRDRGPGIEDVERALQDHYSTSGTLGLGLPGVKRMVDEFDIESTPGSGTNVRFIYWAR